MKIPSSIILAAFLVMLLPAVTLAQRVQNTSFNTSQTQTQGTNTSGDTILINPLGPTVTDLPAFLNSILAFVVQLGTIALIVTLVYVGYLFVAARGVPAKISDAKRALAYTLIGGMILLGAQAIAMAVQATVAALQVG